MGWDHVEKVENHASQKDYKSGFGGEYGVVKQTDKAAHGWEHVEQVDKHQSQKGKRLRPCMHMSQSNERAKKPWPE